MKYTLKNAETIENWRGKYNLIWFNPVTHDTFIRARQGEWDITLTPLKPVPHAWIGDVSGKRVLGLAAGGAQQMPILAALGAECTVLDISPSQLENERLVSRREGYSIDIVQGDMTDPLPFDGGVFDLIINPISNHYVENVLPVFAECYRVLKSGGHLLCGLDTGIHYIFDEKEEKVVHSLPFNPLKDPKVYEEMMQRDLGLQFSHTLEEQIGGQLKAGFRLLDIYEDTSIAGLFYEKNIPGYIATRCQKP